MIYKNGQTSVTERVTIVDSTTGVLKTGLSTASAGLIISTIASNESGGTAYSGSNLETITTCGTFAAPTSGKVRFKEVDSTNHPGLYEIQAADARWAVSNAKSLVITAQATGCITVHKEVQLTTFDLYTATQKVDIDTIKTNPVVNGGTVTFPTNSTLATTTGAVGSVTGAVGSVAGLTASDVNAIKLKTDNLPSDPADASDVAGAFSTVNTTLATISSYIDTEVAAIKNAIILTSGTAQAGGVGTITLAAGASAQDDYYAGKIITITGGTSAPANRRITGYNGTTKVATVFPEWWDATPYATPDNTSTYIISNQGVAVSGIDDFSVQGFAFDNTFYSYARPLLFNYTIGGGVPQADSVADYLSNNNDALNELINVVGGTGVELSTDAIATFMNTTIGAFTSAGSFGAAINDIPTANENADALLDRADAIETGWSIRGILRVLSSVLLGKSAGGGTTTETFRNITDTKDRVVSTNDGADRTSVTLDGT